MITAIERQIIVDAAVAAMQEEIKILRERIEALESREEAPKTRGRKAA